MAPVDDEDENGPPPKNRRGNAERDDRERKSSDDEKSEDDKTDDGDGGGADTEDEDDGKPPLYKRPIFWIVIGIVAAALIVGGILYYLHSRKYESTDDAFVDAHVVRIAAETTGRLSEAHIKALRPLLLRHLELAKPRKVLLLGDAPVQALLGQPAAKARDAAHDVQVGGSNVPVVATIHPRLVAMKREWRPLIWADLQRFETL